MDAAEKSTILFEELQARYGFLGGSYTEYCALPLPGGGAPALALRDRRPREWASRASARCPRRTAGNARMQMATNYMWRDASSRSNLGMHAGASLAALLVAQDTWHVAACDESNAFTPVEVPEWMHAWCSGPPLRARDVRAALPPELQRLPGGVWVYPQYRRLAMGCSHSVRILMPINLEIHGPRLVEPPPRAEAGRRRLTPLWHRRRSLAQDPGRAPRRRRQLLRRLGTRGPSRAPPLPPPGSRPRPGGDFTFSAGRRGLATLRKR